MSSVYLIPLCSCKIPCYSLSPRLVDYCSYSGFEYELFDPHTEDYNSLVYMIKKRSFNSVYIPPLNQEDIKKLCTFFAHLFKLKCIINRINWDGSCLSKP